MKNTLDMRILALEKENALLRDKLAGLEKLLSDYEARPKNCFDSMAQYVVPKIRANNYEMLLSEYKYQGFNDALLHAFQRLEASMFCWIAENNRLWLLYFTVLLENNLHENIEFLIKRYVYYHQLKNVEDYPAVASSFHNLGYTNEAIEKSASIHMNFMTSEKNQEFESLVKGKSIAVVANGPYEVGKGRGREIDEHDIVVRFSQGTDKGFEEDYGSRTDIWVNTAGCKLFQNYRKPDFLLTLWRFDCYYFRDETGIGNLYSLLDKKCQKYGDKTAQFAWNKLGVNFSLTTGSDFLLHLYSVLASFESVDLYGFHFMNTLDRSNVYFNQKRALGSVSYHNFDEEYTIMRKFLAEHGGEKFL